MRSDQWMKVFNEIHNSHLVNTSVGIVTVLTDRKK